MEAVIASIRQKHGVTEKMMTDAMVANQQDPVVQVRGAASDAASLPPQRQLAVLGRLSSAPTMPHRSPLAPLVPSSPRLACCSQAAVTALREAMNGKAPPGYAAATEAANAEGNKQRLRRAASGKQRARKG